MKAIQRFAIGISLLLATMGSGAEDQAQIALTGFHAGAEPVKSGGDWWGLFPDSGGYTLKPTRVVAEAVVNPLADGDTRKTATMIRVPGGEEGLFVFRGLMCAAEGAVDSVKPEKSWEFIGPGSAITLPMTPAKTGSVWSLVAEGREKTVVGKFHTGTKVLDYELRLNGDRNGTGFSQLIASVLEFDIHDGVGPELIWAGDLDRDGHVDLLIDLEPFDLSTDLSLFLSSAAKEGELVGLVARWKAYSNC